MSYSLGLACFNLNISVGFCELSLTVAVLKGARENVRRGLSRGQGSPPNSSRVSHRAREGTRMGKSARPLIEYPGAGPREFLKITEGTLGRWGVISSNLASKVPCHSNLRLKNRV